MQCILTTNINKCRGKKTTRRKKCQIFASVMYFSYQAGVSPEGGLEVGQTKPFARKIIYSGAKCICILKSNTRQETFSTLARHIKCSFLQVREESGLPVRPFLKINLLHKSKMKCFKSGCGPEDTGQGNTSVTQQTRNNRRK